MLVQLESFFSECVDVADKDLVEWLCAEARVRELRKGEAVMRAGEQQSWVNFLVSGVVRSFAADRDGHEATDCLMSRPGQPVMPCARLDVPSPTTLEALVDSVIVSVDAARVLELLESSVAANQLRNHLLQEAWEAHWEVKEAVCQKKARERYLWFLDAYPGLIDQIPNKHVASFLGMTPVTLSRLRTALRLGDRG